MLSLMLGRAQPKVQHMHGERYVADIRASGHKDHVRDSGVESRLAHFLSIVIGVVDVQREANETWLRVAVQRAELVHKSNLVVGVNDS